MPAFHDIRFPSDISLRSSGGPERQTRVVSLSSGHEERNTAWAQSRRRFDAGYGVRSVDDIHAVIAFFEARRGRLHGFRWKDWSDYRSGLPSAAPKDTDQRLGVGDGSATTFRLVKSYGTGPDAYLRPITHPVLPTLRVAVDGLPVAAEFLPETAEIALPSAPGTAAQVTAGFEFDVPVRFDTDRLEVNLASFTAGDIPSIPLIEIRV